MSNISIGNRPNFGAAYEVCDKAAQKFSGAKGMPLPVVRMLGDSAIEWLWSRPQDIWKKELILNLEWRDPTLVVYTIQEAVTRDSEVFHIEPVRMDLHQHQLERFHVEMVVNGLLSTGEHLSFMYGRLKLCWEQYQVESVNNAAAAARGEFPHLSIGGQEEGPDPFLEDSGGVA